MATPPHPGAIVRAEILNPRGLTIAAAAAALGIGRPAFSNFVNGKAALSGDMALRIEKVFGIGMETLMFKQHQFDIAQARAREKRVRIGDARSVEIARGAE
jgi:antitoxin HigA-1